MQVYQEKLQLNIVKDFQTNLINFVNVSFSISQGLFLPEHEKHKKNI